MGSRRDFQYYQLMNWASKEGKYSTSYQLQQHLGSLETMLLHGFGSGLEPTAVGEGELFRPTETETWARMGFNENTFNYYS